MASYQRQKPATCARLASTAASANTGMNACQSSRKVGDPCAGSSRHVCPSYCEGKCEMPHSGAGHVYCVAQATERSCAVWLHSKRLHDGRLRCRLASIAPRLLAQICRPHTGFAGVETHPLMPGCIPKEWHNHREELQKSRHRCQCGGHMLRCGAFGEHGGALLPQMPLVRGYWRPDGDQDDDA